MPVIVVCIILFAATLHADNKDIGEVAPQAHIIVVVGASGLVEYEQPFREWAARWQSVAEAVNAQCEVIGVQAESDPCDLNRLTSSIAHQVKVGGDLWLIFIGHGTYSVSQAKFNLRGPDLSAEALTEQLKANSNRVILIQCASSSGPFLNSVSGKNRIVLTATKSGSEVNYARFGDYLSTAINDPVADLDHDHQVSLLEAFISASGRTTMFYETENRLATEHALIDDNGDSKGTPATFFRGIRPIKRAKDNAAVDGRLAARLILSSLDELPQLTPTQLANRDALEAQLDVLRETKNAIDSDEYYSQLEEIMIGLAKNLLVN